MNDEAAEDDTAMLGEMHELQQRLDALPVDDFAARFELEKRIDDLRARLHDATADDLAAANEEWAERTGRKGEHAELSREELAARARIMPGETGH